MSEAQATSIVVSFREAKARRIRELSEKWTDTTLQLGRELKEARDTFPADTQGHRDGWREWIENEVGFSSTHAAQLIRVSEMFGQDTVLSGAGLGVRVLTYLAREHIPDEGRDEVIRRAKDGETIGRIKAKEIVDSHRPPPTKANDLARETGKPTLASDGNYYFGATKEQERQITLRRETVYGVRRAVETLAAMDMTPEQFLERALPHQLWNQSEEHQLSEAFDWLTDLVAAWESR